MKILKKYKYYITIIIFILLIFTIIFVKDRLNKDKYENIEIVSSESEFNKDINEKNKSNEEKDTICTIDIKGAINNPGVYKTSCDSTVYDVIKLAGDLTENANTSVTNLAKKITNEMVIIIYTDEEVKNSNVVNTVVKVVENECVCPNIQNDSCINDKITDEIGNTENTNLININTATIDEITKIPGIGESKAKAIIEYREKNGKFNKIEDIKNVTGIGSKLYEEIKIFITT